MDHSPRFRTDLYRGTARFYDRYRVPYPAGMIDDLVVRASLSGTGRLLDLACGPGRVTFALARHFAEVVAVDQEEEAVSYGAAMARERGETHIEWRAGRAEDLDGAGRFDLVTIGDAFHRLDRARVAALAHRSLRPGGHLALLWTSMPWEGSAAWQKAAMELVVHWMDAAGSLRNIPADLADALAREPHLDVLAAAGFSTVGTYRFTAPRTWTPETLAGFAHSTSVLSRSALGERVEAFEQDLRDRLLAVQPDGVFHETVGFTYDLAVKPLAAGSRPATPPGPGG